MSQAQLSKLWSAMEQVVNPDEKKTGLGPSLVGLQCDSRSLGDFQRDTQSGIRDAMAFYPDHVLVVRTPPNPGFGTLFKILTKGSASVVPHNRIPRTEITGLSVVQEAPPGWRLMGELEFLRLSTRNGDVWHWIDPISMDGKLEKLLERVGTYGTAK
jgi:hypothetical protein